MKVLGVRNATPPKFFFRKQEIEVSKYGTRSINEWWKDGRSVGARNKSSRQRAMRGIATPGASDGTRRLMPEESRCLI
jgi:hypothetical protein